MGFDVHATKFVLYAKSLGVDFRATALIGRQSLDLEFPELKTLFRRFGYVVDDQRIECMYRKHEGYAEDLVAYLGALEVRSLDYSDYEHATDLHDMNRPLPEQYKGKFTAVIDSGSLEHIFNFPVAIKNCMEMVATGGHFLGIVPANNMMGHGFYQFSPDLYYRVFSNANGFRAEKVICFEDAPDSKWYSLVDPQELKDRVILTNRRPTLIAVLAKKVSGCQIFAEPPQQSFYVKHWTGEYQGPPRPAHFARLRSCIPKPIKRLVRRRILKLFRRQYDPTFFKPVKVP